MNRAEIVFGDEVLKFLLFSVKLSSRFSVLCFNVALLVTNQQSVSLFQELLESLHPSFGVALSIIEIRASDIHVDGGSLPLLSNALSNSRGNARCRFPILHLLFSA